MQKKSRTLLIPILVTAIAVSTSMVHWAARPHVFTILLFPLWIVFLKKLHQKRLRYRWVLSLIMLIWANLRGVFVIGIFTCFIYGFGIAWDQFLTRTTNEHPNLPILFWRYYILGNIASILASLKLAFLPKIHNVDNQL